jgi:hypothetical protein
MTTFSDAAWKDMHPALWVARVEARLLVREMFDEDLVITSGRRPPTPGGSSKHQTGEAMDIRSREWAGPDQRAFATELGNRLGEDYDVIVEGPASLDPLYQNRVAHVHCEWDPRGRHRDG